MKKQLLATVLCCAVLTGCGTAPANNPTGSAESTQTEETVVDKIPNDFTLGCGAALKLPAGLARAAACGETYEESARQVLTMQTSDAAWDALLAGDLDTAIGYAPSAEQEQRCKEQGITLHKIGTDALVILAGGTDAPVALTKSEVLQAFTLQSDTWKGYAAAKDADSRALFRSIFGQDCEGVTVQQGEDTLTAACPHTQGTLCYTTYGALMQNGQPEQTTVVTVDGKLPSDADYALTQDIYVAVRSNADANDPETLFANWLATDKGSSWLHEAVAGTLTEDTEASEAS